MVDIDNFNKQIADVIQIVEPGDVEIRSYISTQYGKFLAGTEAETVGLPEICPVCGKKLDTIAKRRRNTSYNDDEGNWLVSCKDCHDYDTECFEEMWQDYYSGAY